MTLAERVLTESGQRRLARLQQLQSQLECAWNSQDIEAIASLQASLDAESTLGEHDLRAEVRGTLALEAARGLRLSSVEDALRLRGENGLDVRLGWQDGRLSIQGRRRPRFDLYEYLFTSLHPDGSEESVVESAEGRVERRKGSG